jgi:hypothetical protein
MQRVCWKWSKPTLRLKKTQVFQSPDGGFERRNFRILSKSGNIEVFGMNIVMAQWFCDDGYEPFVPTF